jgi:hypothetical protein
LPAPDSEDVEELEEAPDSEVEAAEEESLDQATAARTIGIVSPRVSECTNRSGDTVSARRPIQTLESFTAAAAAAANKSLRYYTIDDSSDDAPASCLKSDRPC